MLHTRLVLGLLCLLIILLAIGLYSISECSQLGKRVEALAKDSDSVGQSLRLMKRNVSSMTGDLLSVATVERTESQQEFQAAAKRFEDNLAKLKAGKGLDGDEEKLLSQLSNSYADYAGRAQLFLGSPRDPNLVWRTAAARLGQDTSRLLDLLDKMSLAHEQAWGEGSKSIAHNINVTVRSLILFMLIAVAITIFASWRLHTGLLTPLRLLTTSIRQIGEGNLDQTVPVLDNDELGALAVSFNQMAAQLRQYQTDTSVELMRLNMTIRATLASFPDPIFVLNPDGAVDFRNPVADQLALKLLFSGVTRLPVKVDEKVEHVRVTGLDYLPTQFKDAIKFNLDGQDRYFLPRIVLLRDDKREVFGVAVILEDVTRMLLLDDVKSNLIATVSHELKTPLTTIRMALYLLHEKTVGELNDKQADLVATAREDSDRLLQTLNDLLDLAKLEQGPSQLQFVRISPGDLVESAVHATREVASAAGVTLTTEIAPDLPEIRVDRVRVAYVFTNLINNAIKYSPADTRIVVRASLGQTRAAKPCVRFSVKDQGPGIATEHQEHIFERFYRIPGTNKSGAGLGLSIAREIAIAHQGEIGVISQLGHGSEFFFSVPFHPSSQALPSATDRNSLAAGA